MIVGAEASAQGQPFGVALEHVVDHARHRIGPVQRRSAVLEHFEALQPVHRDGVGVHRVDRHEAAADLLGLEAGRVDQTAAVEQHQGVARAEVAQVEGAHVAACGVDAAADVLRLIEEVLPLFGQRLEQIVAGIHPEQLDVLGVHHRHRQDAADGGAANVGAGDHHFLDHFAGGRFRCRLEREQRRGGQCECGCPRRAEAKAGRRTGLCRPGGAGQRARCAVLPHRASPEDEGGGNLAGL